MGERPDWRGGPARSERVYPASSQRIPASVAFKVVVIASTSLRREPPTTDGPPAFNEAPQQSEKRIFRTIGLGLITGRTPIEPMLILPRDAASTNAL
jgi:hypothetical protein